MKKLSGYASCMFVGIILPYIVACATPTITNTPDTPSETQVAIPDSTLHSKDGGFVPADADYWKAQYQLERKVRVQAEKQAWNMEIELDKTREELETTEKALEEAIDAIVNMQKHTPEKE